MQEKGEVLAQGQREGISPSPILSQQTLSGLGASPTVEKAGHFYTVFKSF